MVTVACLSFYGKNRKKVRFVTAANDDIIKLICMNQREEGMEKWVQKKRRL